MADNKQWRGPEDGFPPVGQWVRFKQIDESGEELNGMECYVISNGIDEIGHKVTTAYFEPHGYKAFMSDCFHPLRTEEDKAVEDMSMVIFKAGFVDNANHVDYARALYRAGYRKQEEAE